jgi:hypothetical protein
VRLFSDKSESPIRNATPSAENARELGCDEDEAAFEERLRKIAKAT